MEKVINKIKTGDKFFVNSTSFLSKAIRFFMKLYAKKYKLTFDKIYSHVGIFVWIADELYIAESVDNGFNLRVFNQHYDLQKDDYIIIHRNKPIDEKKALKWLINLATVKIAYQYYNFIQWPLLILFNINLFSKGGRKFTYCYEACKRFDEFIEPGSTQGSLEIASFFDIYK